MTEPAASARPSRRTVLGAGAALGVTAPLLGAGARTAAADERGGGRWPPAGPGAPVRSARAALSFLGQVTDAYATSGARLAQSFDDSRISDIAFIYDNALTSMALLAGGDVRRARAVGDALLYAQAHDGEFSDGRLRQAYHAGSFVKADGSVHFADEFGLTGTAVGDMAWTGLALAHLARRTGERAYLDGLLRIGAWIQARSTDEGLGGYTFGETANLADHKSTEHNIDVYGLFRIIGALTGDRRWFARADHALAFVHRVWNAADGFFWTGSDDGSTINKAPTQLPLDVQTWFELSVGERQYAACLDWARTNLATTDTPLRTNSALTGNVAVTGVGFGSGTFRTDVTKTVGGQSYTPKPDDGAVWFEGTGQLALALRTRGRDGDRARSQELLEAIRSGQDRLGAGQTFHGTSTTGGIVAASSPLDTGFGFDYSPNLHVAATSWYLFAVGGFNPYRF